MLGNIPNLAYEWPRLETLYIDGMGCAQDFRLHHFNLRALIIWNGCGLPSPTLDCPLLESLTLSSSRFGAIPFLDNLNSTCLNLKKAEIVRLGQNGESVEGPCSPLTISHKNLVNLPTTPTHVTCPKLGKVVLRWEGSRVKQLRLEWIARLSPRSTYLGTTLSHIFLHFSVHCLA